MSTGFFETEKAIFHFELREVPSCLRDHSDDQLEEATDLLNILKSSSSEPKKISGEKGFFGYILLDLLSKNGGFAFCKACQKTYLSEQLQPTLIQFKEILFSIMSKRKGEFLKGVLKREIKGEGVGPCRLLFSFLHYLTRSRHEPIRLPFSENNKDKGPTLELKFSPYNWTCQMVVFSGVISIVVKSAPKTNL
jgi:hypothetical protein